MRVFDYQCNNEHVKEVFAHVAAPSITCSVCGETALRMVSSPRFKLDGITGSFPTASDKWARDHKQAAEVANKKHLAHNEP